MGWTFVQSCDALNNLESFGGSPHNLKKDGSLASSRSQVD